MNLVPPGGHYRSHSRVSPPSPMMTPPPLPPLSRQATGRSPSPPDSSAAGEASPKQSGVTVRSGAVCWATGHNNRHWLKPPQRPPQAAALTVHNGNNMGKILAPPAPPPPVITLTASEGSGRPLVAGSPPCTARTLPLAAAAALAALRSHRLAVPAGGEHGAARELVSAEVSSQ